MAFARARVTTIKITTAKIIRGILDTDNEWTRERGGHIVNDLENDKNLLFVRAQTQKEGTNDTQICTQITELIFKSWKFKAKVVNCGDNNERTDILSERKKVSNEKSEHPFHIISQREFLEPSIS